MFLLEIQLKYAKVWFKMCCCLKSHENIIRHEKWQKYANLRFKISCCSKYGENMQMGGSKCVFPKNTMKICRFDVQNVLLVLIQWKYMYLWLKCVVIRNMMEIYEFVVQNVLLLEMRWKYANLMFKMCFFSKYNEICKYFVENLFCSKYNENMQRCG